MESGFAATLAGRQEANFLGFLLLLADSGLYARATLLLNSEQRGKWLETVIKLPPDVLACLEIRCERVHAGRYDAQYLIPQRLLNRDLLSQALGRASDLPDDMLACLDERCWRAHARRQDANSR